MELREFAEHVLFSRTLEEKLRTPGNITDETPAGAMPIPGAPGRPKELEFLKGRSDFEFPNARELERDPVRGQLLHFFANHELLATELMALALLRFPDAPKSFRRGLLQTLRDEQEQTRIYIERMNQLGVAFGQYPVTGFFWRTVSQMVTPLDYVSHLSLTFEQANLDYSKAYADLFKTIGDRDSEALMRRIHQDEIGHVGYGLKWFRRWKDPAVSDWQAFQSQLTLPFSPSRAKGVVFNAEARARAGFDQEFIDELLVYSKSKGRTPSVFLSNPFAEHYMALGPGFHPNATQQALARDLSNLPQFLCRRDDVVLVPNRPRTAFLARIKQAGWELPEFQELEAGGIPSSSDLRTRKLDTLRPWAWSPDSIQVLTPLLGQLNQLPGSVGSEWQTRLRPLFSKQWSADRLKEFLLHTGNPDWLCPDRQVGISVNSFETALAAIREIRARGARRLVAKEFFGMAGGNQCRLWEHELTGSQEQWLRTRLQAGRGLILEPWMDRVLDFSIQFESEPGGLRFKGWTKALNDHRGQYAGSVVSPAFTRGMDRSLAIFLSGSHGNRLKKLTDTLRRFLDPFVLDAGYFGPIGVDAFVYRTNEGTLVLKPIVEINPRFTMGRLALELMRNVAPGKLGALHLINRSRLGKSGFESFETLDSHLQTCSPVRLTGNPKLRMSGGALCLNDPSEVVTCLALFTVADHPDGLNMVPGLIETSLRNVRPT